MNAKIYDYRGPALKGQNAIALELNLPQNEVASYQGTMVDGVTYWSNKIEKNYSYTGGQHVDVVRMGVDTADNMDHTNRTVNEDQLPDDLFFGFGGDDTLKGGAGTDFLYGGEGSDTLYGGDGNDFIYADGDYYHQSVSGNDIIYGQAGNDVILAGLGSDRVDGGIGADRIVVGGSGRIDPGPGADKVYVLLLSDASTGVGVTIDHAESSDSLFWNGYRLTGGTLTQLEGEGEIWDIYGYLSSGSSTAGAAYILEKVGDSQINLNIYLPDFQRITIVNWQAGLMGIDLKGGDQFHPIFPLPKSNLVGDGKYVGWDQWYNELTGAAKMLANPGPADVPAYPEPAQATASNESFVRSDGIWDKEAYLMSASHLGSASDLHMCLV